MNYLKIIKTKQDHQAALGHLLTLIDADPAQGSPADDEIGVLALLVEQYEQANFPIDPPDPIEAIRFRMDQMGLKNRDLIPSLGSAPKVSEIFSRKRPLSLNMIRKLNAGLGISAEVLIQVTTDSQKEHRL